jgi:heat shock protein HslJ
VLCITRIFLMASLLTACAPTEEAADLPESEPITESLPPPASDEERNWVGYRAGGNEPFWNITISETTIDFADVGINETASANRPVPERLSNGWRFMSTSNEQLFIVEVLRTGCSDSMSGRPYPETVNVTVNGRNYTGCGGDTASLLTGPEWRVTRLEQSETAGRQPTLSFADDGSLTGHSGCNGYRSTYTITGEGIEIGPAAATRMACAEADLNRQETTFFTLLDQVDRFSVIDDTLQLYSADRPTITARR